MEFKTLGVYAGCPLSTDNCCVPFDTSLISLLSMPMAMAVAVECALGSLRQPPACRVSSEHQQVDLIRLRVFFPSCHSFQYFC